MGGVLVDALRSRLASVVMAEIAVVERSTCLLYPLVRTGFDWSCDFVAEDRGPSLAARRGLIAGATRDSLSVSLYARADLLIVASLVIGNELSDRYAAARRVAFALLAARVWSSLRRWGLGFARAWLAGPASEARTMIITRAFERMMFDCLMPATSRTHDDGPPLDAAPVRRKHFATEADRGSP